jgi:hypothetical protein
LEDSFSGRILKAAASLSLLDRGMKESFVRTIQITFCDPTIFVSCP